MGLLDKKIKHEEFGSEEVYYITVRDVLIGVGLGIMIPLITLTTVIAAFLLVHMVL